MPYVNESDRELYAPEVVVPDSPGGLNYQITMVVKHYLEGNGESYRTYNDIIGALECAKLELYRRMVVPYENKKRLANGDVYNAA